MMRLILNNDTTASYASDNACGTYTSGETDDFVVIFKDASTLSVNNQNAAGSIKLWPNPASGKFNLKLNSNKPVSQLQVNIMSVTGQKVFGQAYNNINGQFSANVDLSSAPRGLYFVETNADGQKQVSKILLQ
jgi:hypothetical protein